MIVVKKVFGGFILKFRSTQNRKSTVLIWSAISGRYMMPWRFITELLLFSLLVSIIGETLAGAFRPVHPYLQSPTGAQGYSCIITGRQIQLTFENEAVMREYMRPGQQFTCFDLSMGKTAYYKLTEQVYSELMNDYRREFSGGGSGMIVFEFKIY